MVGMELRSKYLARERPRISSRSDSVGSVIEVKMGEMNLNESK